MVLPTFKSSYGAFPWSCNYILGKILLMFERVLNTSLHCEELKAITGNKYISHISGANTLMLCY